MDFNIGKTEVFGLESAIKASGNPMRTILIVKKLMKKM